MELGERILSLRKERGLTQDELAAALYVSRQTIYKWESGKAQPDIGRLRQLCLLFHVSADELLLIVPAKDTPLSIPKKSGSANEKAEIQPVRHTKKRIVLPLLIVVAAAVCIALAVLLIDPCKEIREAVSLGVVPQGMERQLTKPISESAFLTLLVNVAHKENGEVSPQLAAALKQATNERLTREEAAYWLYCAHIWTKLASDADLAIGTHDLADPITQRNVYEDLNSKSKSLADALDPPWEWSLCSELAKTGELFLKYGGTAAEDAAINAILYGPYTTGVAFCLGQHSFLNGQPLLETRSGSFRAKELITGKEAILAAYRLYGSW